MPDEEPTFAEQMVEKLQAQLLALGGVSATSSGGVSTTWTDLTKQLEYWQGYVAIEKGERPRMITPLVGGV